MQKFIILLSFIAVFSVSCEQPTAPDPNSTLEELTADQDFISYMEHTKQYLDLINEEVGKGVELDKALEKQQDISLQLETQRLNLKQKYSHLSQMIYQLAERKQNIYIANHRHAQLMSGNDLLGACFDGCNFSFAGCMSAADTRGEKRACSTGYQSCRGECLTRYGNEE